MKRYLSNYKWRSRFFAVVVWLLLKISTAVEVDRTCTSCPRPSSRRTAGSSPWRTPHKTVRQFRHAWTLARITAEILGHVAARGIARYCMARTASSGWSITTCTTETLHDDTNSSSSPQTIFPLLLVHMSKHIRCICITDKSWTSKLVYYFTLSSERDSKCVVDSLFLLLEATL